MALNAMSVQAGVAANLGDHLPKTELIDQLIAFSVVDYDPDEPGDYGRQPRVDVDLLVVTGPHAGTRDEKWRTWGNLAAQMGAQDAGATIAARVTSGPGKVKDSRWYGLSFELTPEEIGEVREAVLAAAGGVQAAKPPAGKPATNGKASKSKPATTKVADNVQAPNDDPPPF